MLMESGQHEESSKDMNTRVVAEDGGGSSSSGGGTSRFYECTFCKQGFTTAQALGGHMNIHRRERARTRQPIVIPSSSPIPIQQSHGHEKHTRPDFPWPNSGSFSQAQDYHHMYLPSSTSSASTPTNRHPHPSVHVDNSQNRIPRSMRLFEEDQSTNLSLRFGYPTEEVNNQIRAEDDEVDLELRLGHDP